MLFLTLSFLLNLQVTCRNSTFFIDKISYKAYDAKIPNNNIFKKNVKIKSGKHNGARKNHKISRYL